jgi:signal transduction histidine kinase
MGDLADAARDLGHGRLDTRVEPSGPPEVVEVGRALNVLAARIAVLLAEEREGVADLSHRLRTPLAALRLEAEAVEDEQERLQLQAAVDDVTRAVDQLIDEARRPLREGIGSKADVAGIARDRLAFWAPLAEEEGRRFRLEAPDRAVVVAGHPDDIAAAIDALVGNVLAHTPEGTAFSVAVEPSADGARLVVADEGPGIGDPALLERGVSGAGSSGLGLDIVRRTAEAGGGSFRVGTADGGGAEVSVDLRSPPPG